MTKKTYLALGSNLGDREAHLQSAVDALGKSGVTVLGCSPVYETEPLEFRNQGWFLNAVLEGETELLPLQLLGRIRAIEKQLGRRPGPPKGPRVIDIDILFFGRFVVNRPGLVVPHPRLAERRFVLEPLVNLAPDLRHPLLRKTVRELLAGVRDQELKRTSIQLRLPPSPLAASPSDSAI